MVPVARLLLDLTPLRTSPAYRRLWIGITPVSYTHLTLPTNREV